MVGGAGGGDVVGGAGGGAAPDICALPADAGPCEAAMPRWFHNAETGGCERFTYGGCEGNANNFETLEACREACGGALPLCGTRGAPPCADDMFCDFPNGSQCGAADGGGMCRPRPQACPDVVDPVCGCDGETYGNACVAATSGVDVLRPGRCEDDRPCAPEECGPRPGLPNWMCADGETGGPTGRCLRGDDGACGWDINDCEPFGQCELPPDPGPCRGALPRWFHESRTGVCIQFIYGGCEGNANNFETQEACEAACVEPAPRCGTRGAAPCPDDAYCDFGDEGAACGADKKRAAFPD